MTLATTVHVIVEFPSLMDI